MVSPQKTRSPYEYVTKAVTEQATAAALGCGIFTLIPNFGRPAYRLVRFVSYSMLGLSAFVPVVHVIIING